MPPMTTKKPARQTPGVRDNVVDDPVETIGPRPVQRTLTPPTVEDEQAERQALAAQIAAEDLAPTDPASPDTPADPVEHHEISRWESEGGRAAGGPTPTVSGWEVQTSKIHKHGNYGDALRYELEVVRDRTPADADAARQHLQARLGDPIAQLVAEKKESLPEWQRWRDLVAQQDEAIARHKAADLELRRISLERETLEQAVPTPANLAAQLIALDARVDKADADLSQAARERDRLAGLVATARDAAAQRTRHAVEDAGQARQGELQAELASVEAELVAAVLKYIAPLLDKATAQRDALGLVTSSLLTDLTFLSLPAALEKAGAEEEEARKLAETVVRPTPRPPAAAQIFSSRVR